MDMILYGNRAASTRFSVSADTEEATFEALKAIDLNPANTWRTTAKGDQYFILDGTAANPILGCCVFNTNLVTGDTLQLQSSDDNFASTDETQDFTFVTRTRPEYNESTGEFEEVTYSDAYCFCSLSRQDYRLLLNSAVVTDAYYEIGTIILFSYAHTFTRDTRQFWPGGYETTKIINQGEYGNALVHPLYSRFFMQLDIPLTSKAQIDAIINASVCKAVVYVLEGFEGTMLLGTLQADVPVNRNYYFDTIDNKTITATVTELI